MNSCPVDSQTQADVLAQFLSTRGVLVLTGAGCSTESGIPDYRDEAGSWKRREPMRFQTFAGSESARRRYWARSLIGWERFSRARPNGSHHALAGLERGGYLDALITQNVDGLHQSAGSRRVIDLHGRLQDVVCLGCGRCSCRGDFQHRLRELNPEWTVQDALTAPDGDADIDFAGGLLELFRVPECAACGGILKPGVVFFGEAVPRETVEAAFAQLHRARALLVVGSSLMVWSGFRFVKTAVERGLPVAAVNLGRTRADSLLTHKLEARCGELLPQVAARLQP